MVRDLLPTETKHFFGAISGTSTPYWGATPQNDHGTKAANRPSAIIPTPNAENAC